MVLETFMKHDFLERLFCPKNLGNEPKVIFLNLKIKSGYRFLLNLFYNENLYYLLCSCAKPIFGKNLFLEIYAKIFSTNKFAGFLNQLFRQNRSLKQPHLHVDTNSQKLKIVQKCLCFGYDQNMSLANLVSGL